MLRLITFVLAEYFLVWLTILTLFLTSGNGEKWARWTLGIDYDADKFGPFLAFDLGIMLASVLGLACLYHYFSKHWNRWKEEGKVELDRSVVFGMMPLPMIFFILYSDRGPFYPLIAFIVHLFKTWYGMPRMITYLSLPLITVTALGYFLPPLTRSFMRIFISLLASLLTIPVVIWTDRIVGGGLSEWYGYLNLPDSQIIIYGVASVTLAYLGSFMILYGFYQGRMKSERSLTYRGSAQ